MTSPLPGSPLFPYTTLFRSEVAERRLVGGRAVVDDEFVVVGERVADRDRQAAGVAFLAVRADVRELHARAGRRSEEHTSELQSRFDLVCRLLLEKKKRP